MNSDMAFPTDMSHLPDDPALILEPVKGRGDPSWIAPALTTTEKTRIVGKTSVFFGPPLAILADGKPEVVKLHVAIGDH